jgi:hypothetical protein
MPVRLPFDGRVVKYAVQKITPQFKIAHADEGEGAKICLTLN